MPSEKSIKAGLALLEGDQPKILGLTIGSHEDVSPGRYIPRAEARETPKLSLPGLDTSKTYLVVGLDIDAPFPSFGVLGPILHWCQPGVKASKVGELDLSAPFVANYIPPSPPPGSSPHRYTFYLYEQPAGFETEKYAPAGGKELGNMGRIRYNLDSWAKEINLGPVLAFNYFTCN